MLKQRVITAIVLLPLALAAIRFMPVWLFSATIAALLLIAAWEWTNLMGLERVSTRFIYLLITLGAMQVFLLMPIKVSLSISLVWWLVALVCVFNYSKNQIIINTWLLGLIGWLVLIPCWISLCVLKQRDPQGSLLLGLMLLVWGADTGAYFIGKRWGKRKLAPKISPNKSYAGLFGALLTTAIITGIFCYSQGMSFAHCRLYWLLAGLVTLASVEGDLFESMLKRQRGIKDSGKILPGHGGVLDRIDSLTAAAPIFTLGYELLTKYY